MTKKTIIIGTAAITVISSIMITQKIKNIKREKHIKKVLTGIGIPEPIVMNLIKISKYPFNKKVKDYIMYKYLLKHIDDIPDFEDINILEELESC